MTGRSVPPANAGGSTRTCAGIEAVPVRLEVSVFAGTTEF